MIRQIWVSSKFNEKNTFQTINQQIDLPPCMNIGWLDAARRTPKHECEYIYGIIEREKTWSGEKICFSQLFRTLFSEPQASQSIDRARRSRSVRRFSVEVVGWQWKTLDRLCRARPLLFSQLFFIKSVARLEATSHTHSRWVGLMRRPTNNNPWGFPAEAERQRTSAGRWLFSICVTRPSIEKERNWLPCTPIGSEGVGKSYSPGESSGLDGM